MVMQALERRTSIGSGEHEIMDHLVEHLAACQREVVINYYLALKTKRFVILTGPPDVDRMRLAQGLAEVIVGRPSLQWCFLPAHPWWTTQTGVPGYYAVTHARFNTMKLLDCIEAAKAIEGMGRPFFVGIERMSPAEVVCYFQDLPRGLLWQADGSTCRIRLPRNLYITGTLDVRRDQNRLALSQKVRDQVTVIQVKRNCFAPSAPPRKVLRGRPDWQRRFVANGHLAPRFSRAHFWTDHLAGYKRMILTDEISS